MPGLHEINAIQIQIIDESLNGIHRKRVSAAQSIELPQILNEAGHYGLHEHGIKLKKFCRTKNRQKIHNSTPSPNVALYGLGKW